MLVKPWERNCIPLKEYPPLAFSSNHPLSLIKKGSGYWKYIQHDNGKLTFMTQYQYETAYGFLGRWIDRLLFRPLLGWATAWSFDSLRLWIEQNKHPKQLIRYAFVYMLTCLFFSLFWFYHGFIDLETNNMAGAAKIGLGILWLSPLKRKWTLHAVQTCIFAVFAFLDAVFTVKCDYCGKRLDQSPASKCSAYETKKKEVKW